MPKVPKVNEAGKPQVLLSFLTFAHFSHFRHFSSLYLSKDPSLRSVQEVEEHFQFRKRLHFLSNLIYAFTESVVVPPDNSEGLFQTLYGLS